MDKLAGKTLPYHAEHKILPTPDRIYLDPRCKMGLVFSTPIGNGEQSPAHCEKCGNGEEGIPYMRVDLIVKLLAEIREVCDHAGYAWWKAWKQKFGQWLT